MENRRGLLVLGLPLLAGVALLGAVLGRPGTEAPAPRPSPAAKGRSAEPLPSPEPPPRVDYTAERPPRPAAPELALSAAEEARVRGTYQNFRTAVATGNRALQDALAPVLRRNPDFATRLAQDELAHSQNDLDRSVAQRTLEALRR